MDQSVEIERANSRFYAAFESLSIEQMDKVWSHSDDTICVHPGWDLVTGWLAIRESWERIFENSKPMRFVITNTRIRIENDIAVVVCLENIKTEANKEMVKFGVLATNIFQRNKDQWLMIHHHGSTVSNYLPPNISS